MIMMEKITINAEKRSLTGKRVNSMRREGKLPAVMYGFGIEPTPVTLDLRDTTRKIQHLTASSLILISLDGKEFPALIQEKQRDFIKGNLLHVDFRVVSLTEKIRTNVPIEQEGVSSAVKDYNGIVVSGISEIQVECLPQFLPERVVVDISSLKEIGSSITVKDINLPKEVDILDDADEMIVVIVGSTMEVEEEREGEGELEEAGSEEPEVIERRKAEEVEEEA